MKHALIKRIRRSNTISTMQPVASTSVSSLLHTLKKNTLSHNKVNTNAKKTISRSRTLPMTQTVNVGDCYIVRMYPRKNNDRKWNVVKLLYKRPDQTWGIQWMNTNHIFKTEVRQSKRNKSSTSPTHIKRIIDQTFFPSWVPMKGGDEVFQTQPPKGSVATYYELPVHRLISKPFQLTPSHHLPNEIRQFIQESFRPQYH